MLFVVEESPCNLLSRSGPPHVECDVGGYGDRVAGRVDDHIPLVWHNLVDVDIALCGQESVFRLYLVCSYGKLLHRFLRVIVVSLWRGGGAPFLVVGRAPPLPPSLPC